LAVSDEQNAFVSGLFAGLHPIMTRKMFGGLGIFSEGSAFAAIGPHEALLIKSRGQLS